MQFLTELSSTLPATQVHHTIPTKPSFASHPNTSLPTCSLFCFLRDHDASLLHCLDSDRDESEGSYLKVFWVLGVTSSSYRLQQLYTACYPRCICCRLSRASIYYIHPFHHLLFQRELRRTIAKGAFPSGTVKGKRVLLLSTVLSGVGGLGS